MTEEETSDGDETTEPELNPQIAHHGAYIEESKLVLRTYTACESYDELEDRVVEENLLNKNTDYYRKNVLREIRERYIPDTEQYSITPLMRVLNTDVGDAIEDWCLYYEFAQDPFIAHVTREYLYPEFERGTLTVQSDNVVEYLNSIKGQYAGLRDRTETTIEEAASKYLSAMKNFGLLEGSQQKEFAVTFVPNEAIAYVVYRLRDRGVTTAKAIIEHDDWQLFLMDEMDVRRRLRDITPAYGRYEKRGSTEQLTFEFDTMEELINAW